MASEERKRLSANTKSKKLKNRSVQNYALKKMHLWISNGSNMEKKKKKKRTIHKLEVHSVNWSFLMRTNLCCISKLKKIHLHNTQAETSGSDILTIRMHRLDICSTASTPKTLPAANALALYATHFSLSSMFSQYLQYQSPGGTVDSPKQSVKRK